MEMVNRYSSPGSFRYGFNNKEKDNEIKGEGNGIAYENRIYDPRIAKWLSIDPLQKKYPNESPYNFTSDNPIYFADKDGKDKITIVTIIGKDGKTTQLTLRDKTQFDYMRDASAGGGYIYLKRDINETDVIDLRATHGQSALKKREISYSDQAYKSNSWEYYFYRPYKALKAHLTGDQSNTELVGLVIMGNNTKGGLMDQNKLPKGAMGSEILDLGSLLSTLDLFRVGGSPTDYLKEGTKLKRLLEIADNVTKSVEKIKESKEQIDKQKEEKENAVDMLQETKKPIDICPGCNYYSDSEHINNTVRKINEMRAKGRK